MNYQAAAYEKVEQYIRNVLHIVAQPPEYFKSCGACTCFIEFVNAVPAYLSEKVDNFIDGMKSIAEDDEKDRIEDLASNKSKKIREALDSIKIRIQRNGIESKLRQKLRYLYQGGSEILK